MAAEALQMSGLGVRTGGPAGPSSTPGRGLTRRIELRRTQDLLARAISRDVIPRLVLAGRGREAKAAVAGAAEVAELVEIALGRGQAETVSFVEQQRAGGLGLEAIYLDLLAPAVCQLGVMWEDDLADFGQVTIATDRLRQVIRTYSVVPRNVLGQPHPTKRALLVPAPGDQHSFGLAMVAEFFGRAGWHLWTGVPASTAELLDVVRADWFAVVGFSVSTASRLDGLSEAIRKIRRLSRNRHVGVLVGGPVFLEHPEMVAMVGADATAADGRQAVLQAHALLDFAQTAD